MGMKRLKGEGSEKLGVKICLWNMCIFTDLRLCGLYVDHCTVCCLTGFFFVYFVLCHIIITRFMSLSFFMFCFLFCVSRVFFSSCIYLFLYLCTSTRTTATWWGVNPIHFISYMCFIFLLFVTHELDALRRRSVCQY